MSERDLAIQFLTEHPDCTFVYLEGKKLLHSTQKGVSPLLNYYDAGEAFSLGAAADRVVGRGAAFLHVLLKTKVLYAGVLSRSAEEVLQRFGVDYRFGRRTERVLNRDHTGPCPMELATQDISDPHEALAAIRMKLLQLKSGKPEIMRKS